MEVCSNTSPEYRRWYCVVDDFYGLTIDEVVAIFSHGWIICIPFLEIDVNIAIEHFMICVMIGRCCRVWVEET